MNCYLFCESCKIDYINKLRRESLRQLFESGTAVKIRPVFHQA